MSDNFITRTTFAFSAENSTGRRGGGTRGKDCEKLSPCIELKAGEIKEICNVEGPGMITHIWLTGYVGHSLILRFYWDDNCEPSVEAPVSAFFGCAYDENFKTREGGYAVLNSAKIMVAPGRGCNSYWEMPFRNRCKITIENRGDKNQTLYYMITGWLGEVSQDIMYFHASYHQEHPVKKGKSYPVVENIIGTGFFAGLSLAVGINGNNTCWVEGEAKMYIDDDIYPSINYTGTEDYFCGSYAFGNDIILNKYQTYSGLYAGMFAIYGDNQDTYNGQQRFQLYRWHEPDKIYFSKNFTMKLDNLGWTGPRYDDYTSVAYYYLKKPQKVTEELPDDNEMIMK